MMDACEPLTFGYHNASESERAAPATKITPQSLREALGPITTDITPEDMERRTAAILKIGVPGLHEMADIYRGQRAIICGSGPSLNADHVQQAQEAGARVIVINTSHDWLIERGVIPDFSIMLDPTERVAGYQTPNRRVTYLLGTTCAKSTWMRFLSVGIRPRFFVPIMTDTQHDTIARQHPTRNICYIAGGVTVGMRAVHIAGWLGFQDIEIHGFDSCYAPGKNGLDKTGLYAQDKPSTHHDSREITVVSKRTGDKFTCISNGSMSRQAISFKSMIDTLPDSEVHGRVGQIRVLVSGDGLIPWMAWKDGGPDRYVEHTHAERMAAKYGEAKHWDYFKGEPRDELQNLNH